MKIGFLTFEDYHGKVNIGSTKIRVDWLLNHWKEFAGESTAERFRYGEKYDVIVFQKVYWTEYAKMFDGIKILDICDPDWLDWQYNIVEFLQEMDGITVPTLEIAEQISRFTDKPITVIPDRIDFDLFQKKKEHTDRMKTVGWFGYQQNFPMLQSAIPILAELDLELIVISNKPFSQHGQAKKINVTNYPWNEETWKDDLLKCDAVLNPHWKKGKWKYKSENKTVQSWALGLPVAHTEDELKRLITEKGRKKEAETKLKLVQDKYDVKESIRELLDFVMDLYDSKKNQITSQEQEKHKSESQRTQKQKE